MSKHTPGPWELWTGCSWRRFGSASTGTEVCTPTVHPHDGHPDLLFPNGGQDGPDARLIAAAPELLEACARLLGSQTVTNPDPDNDPDVIFARAAIAKATGADNA